MSASNNYNSQKGAPMTFLVLLAVLIVHTRLKAWLHDNPTSGFRRGMYTLFGKALTVAFVLWMLVVGPLLLTRLQTLDRVATEARTALAKTISFSSPTPSWSD